MSTHYCYCRCYTRRDERAETPSYDYYSIVLWRCSTGCYVTSCERSGDATLLSCWPADDYTSCHRSPPPAGEKTRPNVTCRAGVGVYRVPVALVCALTPRTRRRKPRTVAKKRKKKRKQKKKRNEKKNSENKREKNWTGKPVIGWNDDLYTDRISISNTSLETQPPRAGGRDVIRGTYTALEYGSPLPASRHDPATISQIVHQPSRLAITLKMVSCHLERTRVPGKRQRTA